MTTCNEERLIDDSGNYIVIRFTGEAGQMYDFLMEYIQFRIDRREKLNNKLGPQP